MKNRIIHLLLNLGVLWCSACATVVPPPSNPFLEPEIKGSATSEVAPAVSQEYTLLTNATVWLGTGEVLEKAFLLFDGTIRSVSPARPDSVPEGTTEMDVNGAIVTPGLIDTHSHLGVYPRPSARSHRDGNEATHPNTAGVWAEHSVWPQDPGIELALQGGVTTLHILPGSANLFGGRGVTMHNRPARGARAMVLKGAPATLKMACGENPKRVYGGKGRGPSTRMGNIHGQRQAFLDAQAHQRNNQKKTSKTLKRDLKMETLVGVLEGRILPQIHCYRADDMLAMLQLSDEFGFQIRSFHHATEAFKIADILAERDVSVSTWADWWGFKMEAYDAVMANAGIVHAAGGRAIIHSDSAVGIQRLNQEAAKALREGRAGGLSLTEQDALQWITRNAAWALGIDDQVGTIEEGKRADLVIWSTNPFSVYAAPQRVFIDGVPLHVHGESAPPWSDFSLGQGGEE